MYFGSFSNNSNRNTKPCKYGPNCSYLRQGNCWFYHPAEHRQRNTTSNYNSRSSRSSNQLSPEMLSRVLDMLQQFTMSSRTPAQRERIQKVQEEKKQQQKQKAIQKQRQRRRRLEEIERERQKQRQKRYEEMQRQRAMRQQRERERMIQRRAALRAQLQMMTNLRRQRQGQPTADFEWYLSKNKSFKAMEVSQETLQELDQCIICFCSFWDTQDQQLQCMPEVETYIEEQKVEQQVVEIKSVPSKELLERELTELYCKHTFHKDCIKKWLLTNPKCPVCRKNFKDHADYNKFEAERKQDVKKDDIKPIQSISRGPIYSSYLNPDYDIDSDYQSDEDETWMF